MNTQHKSLFLLFWGLLLGLGSSVEIRAQDSSGVLPENIKITLFMDWEDNADPVALSMGAYLEEALAQALAELAEEEPFKAHTFEAVKSSPRAQVMINGNYSSSSRFLSFTDNSSAKETQSWVYTGHWKGVLPLLIRETLRSILLGTQGVSKVSSVESRTPGKAKFLDVFEFATPFVDTPVFEDAWANPTGLVGDSEEGIVGLASGKLYHLDHRFRLLSVRSSETLKHKTMSGFFSLGKTSAGTILVVPNGGTEIHYYYPDAEKVESFQLSAPIAQPFASWPDGAIMAQTQDRAQFFMIKDKTVSTVPWLSENNLMTYGMSFVAGPQETLWVNWVTFPGIFVFHRSGTLLKIILDNELSNKDFTRMSASESGILLTSQVRGRFMDWQGQVLWDVDLRNVGNGFNALSSVWVTDSGRYLYFNDLSTRKIYRYLSGGKEPDEFEKKLISWNEQSLLAPTEAQSNLELARLFHSIGALERALSQMALYVQKHLVDRNLQEFLDGLKLYFVRKRFEDLDKLARQKLVELGPESARMSYSQSMIGYEQYLKVRPEDSVVRDSMAQLRKLYREIEQAIDLAQNRNQVQITSAGMDPLFPSLATRYIQNPPGKLSIHNSLPKDVLQLRAEVSMKRFMDYPTSSKVLERLKPGEDIEIDLPMVLNQTVFEVEEDLPVQLMVTIRYVYQGQDVTIERPLGGSLYRKTALVWDDSAKLAAFITPNDEVIQRFAKEAASNSRTLGSWPDSVMGAVKIVEALGAHKIRYVPDPNSPFTKVRENSSVVDTVRFPRITLMYQSGDCDDTTALLASLLEAEGISTAIMTSPGHVFLAFDTGETPDNRWLYQGLGIEVLEDSGRLWIPLESTLLDQGFLSSWKAASRLVAVHKPLGELEMIPLSTARSQYAAVPLPPSSLAIEMPRRSGIDAGIARSLDEMKLELYQGALVHLGEGVSKLTGRALVRNTVRTGVLHARFGEGERAETALVEGFRAEPKSVSTAVNLANLYLSQKKPDRALEILNQARKSMAQSASLNLLLAQVYMSKGQEKEAAHYWQELNRLAPNLAEQYAWLGTASSDRASAIQRTGALHWVEP